MRRPRRRRPPGRGEHAAAVVWAAERDRTLVEERGQPAVRVSRIFLARGLGGTGCGERAGYRHHTLRNASTTLCPPNPNELLSAASGPRASCARLAADDVRVDLVVEVVDVDGRRGHAVVQREHRRDGLDAARATEQVAGHRLRGGDRDVVGVVAEDLAQRLRLGDVAVRRRRRVRVDVHDLGRRSGRRRPAGSAAPWRCRGPSARAARCGGASAREALADQPRRRPARRAPAACSADSRTTTPAPSPRTKPSRAVS